MAAPAACDNASSTTRLSGTGSAGAVAGTNTTARIQLTVRAPQQKLFIASLSERPVNEGMNKSDASQILNAGFLRRRVLFDLRDRPAPAWTELTPPYGSTRRKSS